MVALMTGRTPEQTGVLDDWSRGAPAEGPTLAAAMERQGYLALGLPADALLHTGTRIGRGFGRYEPRSPSFPDSARVDTALAWLAGPGRRFVWLGLGFGEPAQIWLRDGAPGWTDSAYTRRAAQLDGALARLDRGLSRLGGEVALMVVGTHGAPLASEEAYGESVADFEVPFVIRAPGISGRRDAGPASLLDVAPTLAALAGSGGFAGGSLLARGAAPRAELQVPTLGDSGRECRVRLRRWLLRPAGSRDSTVLALAAELRAACPGSARHAIEQAVTLSLAGSDDPAANLFLQAEKRFPDDHRIPIAYADHLIRHRHNHLVATALSRIPADSPLASDAAWREAVAAMAAFDFAAARQAIERAAALSVPAEFRDARVTAERLLKAKAATELAPTVEARIAYGRALGDFGAMDEAFRQFNQARFADSTRVDADLALAEYLERAGRPQHAIKALERIVERFPHDAKLRRALAEALAAHDENAKAIAQYRALLDLDPSDSRSHYNLACLYARTGQAREGLASLERALQHGYRDWDQIERDPDLAPVRALGEWGAVEKQRPSR
jgi:tetratricopeptide (TPR) repeat protein